MEDAKNRAESAITRARTDLEEALEALKKIPAGDSGSVAFYTHALNNYLNVAGGVTELILKELGDSPNPQVRHLLEGVQHATELMARTVAQMMNKSTNQGNDLWFEKVDLPVLIHRCCSYHQHAAKLKMIRLQDGCIGDIPPVWTDRVAVAAIMDNLLSNAVKYSECGKQVQVQIKCEDHIVVCHVQDEGPGLSPEDQAKLFQRGMRLTPQPTAGELSTGYGLAVAKELIDKLGGIIWCESELGAGCCFSFQLPVYEKKLHDNPQRLSE
jgi:signal transduction histidine kinase